MPAEWNMTAGNFATAWGAYDLFETPANWNSVDVAWYRRTVDVPAGQRGQRIVLRFEAVNFEATVFFNGTKVALHSGGLLPFEADVTDQVSWGGTNTVHVGVRSGNAAARQSDGWHYPNGSWWGQTCWGIWQDVWLLSRPAVYVRDSYVVTSVSSQRITVTTTLANDGATAATATVNHRVLDSGNTVLTDGQGSQVSVPAGGTATVTFASAWTSPRLWSPADPHLYDLAVTTRPAAGGGAADSYSVRFGFREVAVNGTDILLNGEPVMLRGDAWHYMGSVENSRAYATAWFTMVKALGVNYLRLHAMPYPPVFYDVADEMGLLLVAESGIYGSSGNYALSAADFWDNCVSHLTDRVLRDRNHPSVFAWSAENEMLAAFGQSWAAKVAALKPVVTALDTTRPVYFEGDGDPQGAGDLESTHYPWEITTSNTAIPESAYALAPGGQNAGFWDRKKPMLVGEFSSMYYATPSQVSAIGGPATYANLDGLWSAHALIVGAQIEGLRYAGTTGISPWNTVWYGMRHLPFDTSKESLPLPEATGPKLLQVGRYATTLNPGFESDLPRWEPNPIHDSVVRVMPSIAALATDYRTHFWGGGTFTRTYAVYNEVGTQRTVTVSWTLQLTGGRNDQGIAAGRRSAGRQGRRHLRHRRATGQADQRGHADGKRRRGRPGPLPARGPGHRVPVVRGAADQQGAARGRGNRGRRIDGDERHAGRPGCHHADDHRPVLAADGPGGASPRRGRHGQRDAGPDGGGDRLHPGRRASVQPGAADAAAAAAVAGAARGLAADDHARRGAAPPGTRRDRRGRFAVVEHRVRAGGAEDDGQAPLRRVHLARRRRTRARFLRARRGALWLGHRAVLPVPGNLRRRHGAGRGGAAAQPG